MSDAKPRFQFFAAGQRPARERRPLDELGDLFFSGPEPPGPRASHDENPPHDDPPPAANDLPPAHDDTPSSYHDAPPPTAEELLTPPALEHLLANAVPPVRAEKSAAEPAVEVIALLAGGLPLESRDHLARLAACRLAAVEHDAPQPPVVTFRGRLATVSTLAGLAPAGDPVTSLRRRAAQAGRLVLIVAEHVGTFLSAGRQLPEHCVTLVTPDAESLVEAYRELKVATAATVGPVPEIYVLEASAQAQAERTYRRLARVAIAHLGSTPTFAGAALETPGRPADSGRHVAAQAAGAAADRVYRAVAPLFGVPVDEMSPQPEPTTDPHDHRPAEPLPTVAVEVRPAEADPGQRVTAPPVAGVVRSRPASIPLPLEGEVPPSGGGEGVPLSLEGRGWPEGPGEGEGTDQGIPLPLEGEVPPLGGGEGVPLSLEGRGWPEGPGEGEGTAKRFRPVFSTWQPSSPDELQAAVRDSIAALLPGARGLVEIGNLVRVPEKPDLLVADQAGRPVAVLLADGRSADVLRRAVLARQWLLAYAPLLARAFPASLLNGQADDVRTIVLVPESAVPTLESLTPPQVALVAWTPIAFGSTRGLLFRQVLWPLGAAPAAPTAATIPPAPPNATAGCQGPARGGSSSVASAKEEAQGGPCGQPAAESPIRPTPAPSNGAPAAAPPLSRRSVVETIAEPVDADASFDPGTSPDDDLSADEINDLAGPFELDELT